MELLDKILDIRFRAFPIKKAKGTFTTKSLCEILDDINKIMVQGAADEKFKKIQVFDYITFYWCRFAMESFEELLKHQKKILKREYVSIPVSRIRDPLDARGLAKIIKSPGRNFREKLSNAKMLDVKKFIFSIDSLENQALAQCVRSLLKKMKEKKDLIDEFNALNTWFRKSEIKLCSPMKTKIPNYKLLFDEHYRKIWLVYKWLKKLEKTRESDEENINSLFNQVFYLSMLARLRNKGLIVPESIKDFSQEKLYENKISLLLLKKDSWENIVFEYIKENKWKLANKELDIKVEASSLTKENIDNFIEQCVKIPEKVPREKDIEANANNYFPYRSFAKNKEQVIYVEQGLKLTPDMHFAVENISSIIPLSKIKEPEFRSRMERSLWGSDSAIYLITDTLERDPYKNLDGEPLPMSVAYSLSKFAEDARLEQIDLLNLYSNPVSCISLEIIKENNDFYFLRKIPQELEDLESIDSFYDKVADMLRSKDLYQKSISELISDIYIKRSVVESFISRQKLFLYDQEQYIWREFTIDDHIKNLIDSYREKVDFQIKEKNKKDEGNNHLVDFIGSEVIFENENLKFDLLDVGRTQYFERLKAGKITWKEELVPISMYIPSKEEQRILRVDLVDETKSVEPSREPQDVSPKKYNFILPAGKQATISLKWNKNEIRYVNINYIKELKVDTEVKMKVSYNYMKEQPYSIHFENVEEDIFYDTIIDTKAEKSGVDTDTMNIPKCTQDHKKIMFLRQQCPNIDPKYMSRKQIRIAITKDDKSCNDFLIKMFSEDNKELFEDMWTLSYALWFDQDLILRIFDKCRDIETFNKKDPIENINKLLNFIQLGFENILKEMKTIDESTNDRFNSSIKRGISNYSGMILLVLFRLRLAKNEKIRYSVSISNDIMQKTLFKLYEFESNSAEIRDIVLNKNKGKKYKMLYTDGFDFSQENNESLINMDAVSRMIHDYATSENPKQVFISMK